MLLFLDPIKNLTTLIKSAILMDLFNRGYPLKLLMQY